MSGRRRSSPASAASPSGPRARRPAWSSSTAPSWGRSTTSTPPRWCIGRSSKCDIQIDQESISRNHSKIVNTGKSILVRDLGSTNGTYVNDEPVDEYVLRDGDLIKIGRTIFKFLTGGNIENAYHEEIYRLTTIDGLTQIFNKRYFLETLEREIARAHRYRRAAVAGDVRHRPLQEDQRRLRPPRRRLRAQAPRADGARQDPPRGLLRPLRRRGVRHRAARDRRRQRLPFAEKIRQIVEKTEFKFENARIPVTISMGVATIDAELTEAAGAHQARRRAPLRGQGQRPQPRLRLTHLRAMRALGPLASLGSGRRLGRRSVVLDASTTPLRAASNAASRPALRAARGFFRRVGCLEVYCSRRAGKASSGPRTLGRDARRVPPEAGRSSRGVPRSGSRSRRCAEREAREAGRAERDRSKREAVERAAARAGGRASAVYLMLGSRTPSSSSLGGCCCCASRGGGGRGRRVRRADGRRRGAPVDPPAPSTAAGSIRPAQRREQRRGEVGDDVHRLGLVALLLEQELDGRVAVGEPRSTAASGPASCRRARSDRRRRRDRS